MPKSASVLVPSLAIVVAVALAGVLDPDGLVRVSSLLVGKLFESRAWFVMLSVSGMLVLCVVLALSPVGAIRLGADDDRPEFSTVSWLTMLFAAGMGVGLLFWAAAEPLYHFGLAREDLGAPEAASAALFVTNFHWGLHAWAIYGVTALAIAYFAFRKGAPMLVSAPFGAVFPGERWSVVTGWLADCLAIAAIAIGVAGSIAMGVFQIADGVGMLLGIEPGGTVVTTAVFVVLVACYLPPLLVDLGNGMARLSNLAMAIAIGLLCYVIIAGPTSYLMDSVVSGFGTYVTGVLGQGFRTYSYFGPEVDEWFQAWTLTYMVWWLAWGPFVGVFIARISRGRTIREFVLGVLVVPSVFSVIWFGAFGGVGFYEALRADGVLAGLAATNAERVTFVILDRLPLATLTTLATVLAAFLFVVTSVVSAAFVLGMFSSAGTPEPSRRIKLVWGGVLAVLGYAMILSGSIDAIKKVIALGAMPFVFITILICVCLLRALLAERRDADR